VTILAIETSTTVCAAALISEGAVLAERTLNEPHLHSEKLLTLVDSVLSGNRTRPDAVAVSIGPGSFTGLRIGLSVAKGLCFAWETPLIPVPTLHALAWNSIHYSIGEEGDYVLPLLDARRNEVYAALYQRLSGDMIELLPARAMSFEASFELLRDNYRTVVLGEASGKFMDAALDRPLKARQMIAATTEQRQCSAASVGIVGERMLNEGVRAETASLEPMYLKDFVPLVQPQRMVIDHGMV